MDNLRLLFIFISVASTGCSNENERDWLPPKKFQADIAAGKTLYTIHCHKCHGIDASGSEKGPALTDKIYDSAHHADLAFYMAVNAGVLAHHWHFGNMPPIPGLSNKDVAHIVAYIREQQRLAGVN